MCFIEYLPQLVAAHAGHPDDEPAAERLEEVAVWVHKHEHHREQRQEHHVGQLRVRARDMHAANRLLDTSVLHESVIQSKWTVNT